MTPSLNSTFANDYGTAGAALKHDYKTMGLREQH